MEDIKKVKQETEAEKIARLEAKHGHIMVISFDDGEHMAYIKKPSRQVKDKVLGAIKDAPHFAAEIMLENCLIRPESSSIILEDDNYLLGAFQAAQEFIKIKQFEIKKN